MVIRPILPYSSTVWWPMVRYNVSRIELSKIQTLVCLAITGAMKTNPAAAMEVLLGLPPLHVMIEAEAQAGIYRLMCNQQWKPKFTNFGHTKKSQDMEHEPILQMGSDRMLPRYATTSHSQSSSLTSVNGRMGSTQTTKGAWSGTQTGHHFMKPGDFEDISVTKILHFAQGAGLLNERAKRLHKRSITVEVQGSLWCPPFRIIFWAHKNYTHLYIHNHLLTYSSLLPVNLILFS
jgi:hypothetical protein